MELNKDDLKYFVQFLLLDHAWRLPSGKRPKEPFIGFWLAYHKAVKNMRGLLGDIAHRKRACVRALHTIGKKPVAEASRDVARDLFLYNLPLMRNDNNSPRPNVVRRGAPEEANSIRTDYQEYGCDDTTWDCFVSHFLGWRDWVLSESGNTAFQAMQQRVQECKEQRGEVIAKDRIDRLNSLVITLRKDAVQQKRNHKLILESAAAAKRRIESGYWDRPSQSPSVEWQSLATDHWKLGRLLAKTKPRIALRHLKQALQLWLEDGKDLAPQVRDHAIKAVQAEIAALRRTVLITPIGSIPPSAAPTSASSSTSTRPRRTQHRVPTG